MWSLQKKFTERCFQLLPAGRNSTKDIYFLLGDTPKALQAYYYFFDSLLACKNSNMEEGSVSNLYPHCLVLTFLCFWWDLIICTMVENKNLNDSPT